MKSFLNRNKYFTAKILIRFMTFTQSSIFTANIFAFFIKNRGQYISGDHTLKQHVFRTQKGYSSGRSRRTFDCFFQ